MDGGVPPDFAQPVDPQEVHSPLLQEGAAQFQAGAGFFNPASRPSRDLGVLLAIILAQARPLRVLDLMAGCGLRSLRYGLEAGARALVVNDADSARLSFLRQNLSVLEGTCVLRTSALRAHRLLAHSLLQGERFDLVDVDAFGSPYALVPSVLEAVALDGVVYLATSDGRGPTGHDRRAALRHLGASVRCHPASWELALRLQLGVIARAAWSQGRGVEPLFSFSDGRTFRTAVCLRRHPRPDEERRLGLLAICHRCGDQQVQPLLRLKCWEKCLCQTPGLAISGPLWIGPLQDIPTLDAMAAAAQRSPSTLAPEGARLLGRLSGDRGSLPRCWPSTFIARQLGISQPPLQGLVRRLSEEGYQAGVSGLMPGQLRSDAPWGTILSLAEDLARGAAK
jgi:tRNA (guanine26-N2/guanine27-N2)-dimethyltransferase